MTRIIPRPFPFNLSVPQSEALGRSHAAGRLDRVLSGALLEQWRERAAAVKANGWCALSACLAALLLTAPPAWVCSASIAYCPLNMQ